MRRHAVAFKIYDLNDTGNIEKDEVQRLLVALLQDNPAIDLTEDEIEAIVEQVHPAAPLQRGLGRSPGSQTRCWLPQ